MPVANDSLILSLVRNESLTRGLGDEEARMLVDWVVDWTELLSEAARSDAEAEQLALRLLRRAKAIRHFVQLWQDPAMHGAAAQLAATERFLWPLPDDHFNTPAELMETILNWENNPV
jgi:hypothetical protein